VTRLTRQVARDRNAWTFAFVPQGDGPPAACRARRLLKIAGRSLGMRCVGFDLPPRHVLTCHANAAAGPAVAQYERQNESPSAATLRLSHHHP
jgi:hypothetical protein